MVIEGTDSKGIVTQLYKDTSPLNTPCTAPYPWSGTSICRNVIALPINSEQLVQNVTVSTASYLNLCEVEVFAGMKYFYK